MWFFLGSWYELWICYLKRVPAYRLFWHGEKAEVVIVWSLKNYVDSYGIGQSLILIKIGEIMNPSSNRNEYPSMLPALSLNGLLGIALYKDIPIKSLNCCLSIHRQRISPIVYFRIEKEGLFPLEKISLNANWIKKGENSVVRKKIIKRCPLDRRASLNLVPEYTGKEKRRGKDRRKGWDDRSEWPSLDRRPSLGDGNVIFNQFQEFIPGYFIG